MHVASTNPVAVDAEGVDEATIEREKTILADKYRQQGKPEAAIAKIVDSGIRTYFKEVTLLDQVSVHPSHDGKTIAQALKEAEGAVGGPVGSRASCAMLSARASKSRKATLPPRWRLKPDKKRTILAPKYRPRCYRAALGPPFPFRTADRSERWRRFPTNAFC